ncbi:cationic amino acid transporter 4-like [Oppia nitens]|uniref:cationic amino acid transporter 4-like n=1 Tax=Oppia nitens TaxID=1686743 RepID=UPI0023D9FFBA|nr:cationic amino acid transporter 4-like [Oppia nitens]
MSRDIQSTAKVYISDLWFKMKRTKQINRQTDLMETQLRRCLSTFDIVLMGIGHMVGSGAYVLTSSVARNISGPAIVLSFIISGIASFLNALSYAEFAGRFPKCGSAYSYAYLALGEIWSFIVGWNMVLENVIGTAAVSRACSAYIDSLMNGQIRNYTLASLASSIGLNYFSSHVDLFAFTIVIVLIVFMTTGVKITSYLNNVFSIINIAVILTIIVVGLYFADIDNWLNAPNGFMAYGWSGVFAGSATCFYAYVGFDSISSSGEEARNPKRSIPLATFISMTFVTLSYVAVSAVLTLMIPYNEINAESGLPDAFGSHGAVWAKLVVIVGASCGMVTVLIGTMYSLTRIVYAMSDDGLLFSWMGSVNQRTQLPLNAMYFFASLGALMALFIDITTLIEMMSIGTLIAYLVVSASVIVIRYEPTLQQDDQLVGGGGHYHHQQQQPGIGQYHDTMANNQELNDLSVDSSGGGGVGAGEANKLIDELATAETDSLGSSSHSRRQNTLLNLIRYYDCRDYLRLAIARYAPKSMVSIAVLFLVVLLFVFCLSIKHFNRTNHYTFQKQNMVPLGGDTYKVPLVPLVPVLSIFFNIGLMINLQTLTWLRLIVWMIVGLFVYFCYGINHSKIDNNFKQLQSINSENVRKWGSLDDNVSMSSAY